MEAFEEKLRHHFRDRALLKTALTHSSFANESRAAGCVHLAHRLLLFL